MKTNLEMAKECGAELLLEMEGPKYDRWVKTGGATFQKDELDTYTAAAIAQATEQLQSKYDDVCLKWHDAVDAREQLQSEVEKWKRGTETYESAYKEMYAENEQLRSQVVGLVDALTPLFEILRLWEPDWSSGIDRQKIVRAHDAVRASQPTYDEILKGIEVEVLESAKQKIHSERIVVVEEGDADYNGGIADSYHIISAMIAERTGKEG